MDKGEAITAAELRLLLREGKHFMESTCGPYCRYLLCNIAILPNQYASDFETFCRSNDSACTLIYNSDAGEVETPGFTEKSDIRTDIPAYKVFKDGIHTDTLPDLTKYPWENMVSFYLGCSFSFEDNMRANGIVLEKLGVYTTNIKCNSAGIFTSDMVVTMRDIPKGMISTAVEASINLDFAHGAPIHIGRPEDIGIDSIEASEFGYSVTKLEDDKVPVFWACGITSTLAMKAAKLPICFSHHPGSMFVTDVLSDDAPTIIKNTLYPKPFTVCLDEINSRYSVLSENTWVALNNIEEEINEDPGKRGIHELIVESDFNKACLSLSKNSSHVGITLGFPCLEKFHPSEENDGIVGAVYIAKALMYLNKDVTFIVDEKSTVLKKTLSACFTKGFLGRKPNILSVGCNFSIEDTSYVFDDAKKETKFSHLISIERPSPAQNGKYHTMTGRDISEKCDPIDILFEQAKSFTDIVTIGIGDGGNEVGMGKVRDKVIQCIPNGDVIAAATSCDYLITCGVSNWGGLAIACGLFAVRKCPVHDRYQRNGIGFRNEQMDINKFVPRDSEDEALHEFIRQQGFRDGISGELVLTVDNLDYYKVHAPKLRKCRELVSK